MLHLLFIMRTKCDRNRQGMTNILNIVWHLGILSEKKERKIFRMIHQLAVFISNKARDCGVLEETDLNIVRYGLEFIISSLLGFMIVCTISVVSHKWYLALIFTICFVPLRLAVGGFHASSYLLCNLAVACVYGIVLVLLDLLVSMKVELLWFGLVDIIICIVFLKWTPVENANKPIIDHEKTRLKRKGLQIGVAWMLSAMFLYKYNYEVSCFITLCLITVAASVAVAILEDKIRSWRNRYEEDFYENG